MDILRIPSSYYTQIKYLSKDDSEYVLKTIFGLAYGEDIKIEQSLRGGLVVSIWREAIQMENKARAKKGEKRLDEAEATLMADTDEPLGSGNNATNSNQVTSSQIKSNQNNIISKEITKQSFELEKIDNRKEDINKMQEIIKDKVLSLGLIYKSGSQERNRIQNILTAKDFGMICEKANMSRIDFVLNIIELSTKLEFWKGKIYNAETLYKHYASVYNEAVRIKSERKKPRGC